MLRLLHRLGFRWQPPAHRFLEIVKGSPGKSPIPLLAWQLEAGCHVDWPAALAAAKGNPTLTLVAKAWLQERSSPL
jgi:hypothetical protein